MRAWSANERVISMSAETARKAIETLMRLVGQANGVEIEVTIKERKDHD